MNKIWRKTCNFDNIVIFNTNVCINVTLISFVTNAYQEHCAKCYMYVNTCTCMLLLALAYTCKHNQHNTMTTKHRRNEACTEDSLLWVASARVKYMGLCASLAHGRINLGRDDVRWLRRSSKNNPGSPSVRQQPGGWAEDGPQQWRRRWLVVAALMYLLPTPACHCHGVSLQGLSDKW